MPKAAARQVRNVYANPVVAPSSPTRPPSVETSRRPRWLGLSVGAAVIVGLLLVWLGSTVLAKAVVEVKPRQLTVALDRNLTAVKIPPEAGLALQFTVITLPERQLSQIAPATQSQAVSVKSSGLIVVYNTTAAAQPLIANTRFETPAGKIYRIREPITVPARRLLGGQTAPGALEVLVYAEEPGESYNGPETDFTIPGFRGDPRFETIYARSRTPLSGGFVGERRTASPAEAEAVAAALQENLRNELIEEAKSQLPDNLILYDRGAVVKFYDLSSADAPDRSAVTLTQAGVLEGIVLNRSELNLQLIGDSLSAELAGLPYEITNLDRLNFSLASREEINPATADIVVFNLTGDAEVVFKIDAVKVAEELKGKEKQAVPGTLGLFPEIADAEVRFRPPWISRVPADPERIVINVKP